MGMKNKLFYLQGKILKQTLFLALQFTSVCCVYVYPYIM